MHICGTRGRWVILYVMDVIFCCHSGLNTVADILQTTFSNTFSWKKSFILGSTKLYFPGSNWQPISNSSGNGFVPKRAITGSVNSPPGQKADIWADANFGSIFLNENDRIQIQISLKFVPWSPIDNKLALVQVMAWCRTGDEPLPEPMMMTQFNDPFFISSSPFY